MGEITPRRKIWSRSNRSWLISTDPTPKKIMGGRWGSKVKSRKLTLTLGLPSRSLPQSSPTTTTTTTTLTVLWPDGFAAGKKGNLPPPSILDKAISAGRSGCFLFFFLPDLLNTRSDFATYQNLRVLNTASCEVFTEQLFYIYKVCCDCKIFWARNKLNVRKPRHVRKKKNSEQSVDGAFFIK